MRLAGTSIVVTGATGIAAASALAAAREGASVFVVSKRRDECEALTERAAAESRTIRWTRADLTVEGETEAAFGEAREALGRIDGLLAVAGGSGRRFGDGPAAGVPLDAWDTTLEINGRPAFLAARETLRAMADQEPRPSGSRGSVVLVSSVLASHPSPAHFATHAYAASKGAIDSLARTLAAYHAPDRIRVNAIAPGLVRTPMSARAASDPVIAEYAGRKQPLAGGLLEPADVAGLAVFLLSDESSRITGQVISVDGGWSVTEA